MRTLIVVVSLSLLSVPACFAATKQAACQAPVYRQLDFWVGDWDTFDANAPAGSVAHNRVDIILGGCVVREVYRQNDGLIGRSFSIYDATRKIWHQTWVTNRGELLVLEGHFQNGRMTLAGSDVDASGRHRLTQASWIPVKDGVREIARRSIDGGKTWTLWFDIVFRPHLNP